MVVQCLGLANEGVATDGDDCSNRYVGHGRLSQNGYAPTRPELIDLTRPDPTRSAFLLGPAQPGPVDWVGRGGGRVCSGGHGRRGVTLPPSPKAPGLGIEEIQCGWVLPLQCLWVGLTPPHPLARTPARTRARMGRIGLGRV